MTELIIPDCGWAELEERLLGPGCDRSKLQTERSWLGVVKEHFRRFDFDYGKAVELLKDPDILNDVTKIMGLALGGKWVVLNSIHAERMDVIQKIVPIVYTLTMRKKSFLVSTEGLIDLFKQPWRRDAESIVQHESVTYLETMKTSGLLFWERINAIMPGAVKFSGYFDSLLKCYTRRGSAVIATMVHWQAAQKNDKLLGEIAAAVGDVVAYYFKNYAKFLNVGES